MGATDLPVWAFMELQELLEESEDEAGDEGSLKRLLLGLGLSGLRGLGF